MMRLFVAIWLPDDVVDALPLALLNERISRQGVRFTRRDRIHVTLRFLGNVPEPEVPALTSALAERLAECEPVEMSVAGVGAFPGTGRPAVVWVGVRGDLTAVRERTLEATDDFAEMPDDKPYAPHLTIARVSPPSQKVGRALQPLVEELGDREFGKWTANEVALVRTLPDGSYEAVATFPLNAGATSN